LQIRGLLLAFTDRMTPSQGPSEEFLDAVLAIHDREAVEPGAVPGGPPGDDRPAAPDSEASSASTSPETDQDRPETAVQEPPAKKRRTYATKKRMKAGTDTFGESIDWMLARIRRARGDTYAEIAADIGCSTQTLTARFSREGWAKEIDALHEAAQRRFEDATQTAITKLVEQGKSYREKMARASLVFADSVAKMNGAQLLAKAKDISSLNTVARQTLGLDEDDKDQKTIVNIGFLAQRAEDQGVALSASTSSALPPPTLDLPPSEAEVVPLPSPSPSPTE
jgi:hypothetical protein